MNQLYLIQPFYGKSFSFSFGVEHPFIMQDIELFGVISDSKVLFQVRGQCMLCKEDSWGAEGCRAEMPSYQGEFICRLNIAGDYAVIPLYFFF